MPGDVDVSKRWAIDGKEEKGETGRFTRQETTGLALSRRRLIAGADRGSRVADLSAAAIQPHRLMRKNVKGSKGNRSDLELLVASLITVLPFPLCNARGQRFARDLFVIEV
jgi:hypothetical protein